MKAALELLGQGFNARSEILASDSKPVGLVEYQLTEAQLEALVRRAREEMRDACAAYVSKQAAFYKGGTRGLFGPLADRIRALLVSA